MKTRLLIPLVLSAAGSVAYAQQAPLLLASAEPTPVLLPQPSDLDRHTSKVAEFRLQEITEDIGKKLDDEMKKRLQESQAEQNR